MHLPIAFHMAATCPLLSLSFLCVCRNALATLQSHYASV